MSVPFVPHLVRETAEELCRLVDDRLPIHVEVPPGSHRQTLWDEIAPLFLVRSVATQRSLMTLMESRALADAYVLTRVLYEHVVAFAWLAADPSEERVGRWIATDEQKRRSAAKDWAEVGEQLFSEELTQFADEMIKRYKGGLTAEQMAREADDLWYPHLDGILPPPNQLGSFRSMYRSMFRWTSSYVHPAREGLADWVQVGEQPGRLSVPGRIVDRPGARWNPWTASLVYVTLMLLVSARALGWPDFDTVADTWLRYVVRSRYGDVRDDFVAGMRQAMKEGRHRETKPRYR